MTAAVIHIDASASCLEQCGEPYDLLCAVIDRASNAKVVDCLGPDRVAEICDVPETCPLTWTVRDGDGNVLASGVVADPCATPVLDVDVDCAGGSTLFDLVVKVNGEELVNGQYDSSVDNTINVN